jgi:hypothetical protein
MCTLFINRHGVMIWDMLCTHITLRRVRVTIVVVAKQYVLRILSVCLREQCCSAEEVVQTQLPGDKIRAFIFCVVASSLWKSLVSRKMTCYCKLDWERFPLLDHILYRFISGTKRQAMYISLNTEVRLWKPLLQWKSNTCYIFWVCICNITYPACKAHAACYSVICGLSISTPFFHIIS